MVPNCALQFSHRQSIESSEIASRLWLPYTSATWEEPHVLDKPKAKEFDRENCIERFRKANPKDSYYPHWGKAKIPKFPSKEEARFWLASIEPGEVYEAVQDILQEGPSRPLHT